MTDLELSNRLVLLDNKQRILTKRLDDMREQNGWYIQMYNQYNGSQTAHAKEMMKSAGPVVEKIMKMQNELDLVDEELLNLCDKTNGKNED